MKYLINNHQENFLINEGLILNNFVSRNNKISFFPNLIKEDTNLSPNEIKNILIEELDKCKKIHLFGLSLRTDYNEKLSYLKNVQNEILESLFFDNRELIKEIKKFLSNNLIRESVIDLNEELKTFYKIVTEGFWGDVWSGIKSAGKAVYKYSGAEWAVNKLSQAVNYIKEKGVSWIMENIRSALTSGVGTAIQVALSFTGVGGIATMVVWGIMTLYDAYQYFANNGSIFNLIISLINTCTAGTIGKFFNGLLGKAASGVSGALQKMLSGAGGGVLKGVFSTIRGAFQSLSNLLGQAVVFVEKYMGIAWLRTMVSKVQSFFTDLVEKLGLALGNTAGAKLGAQFVKNTLARFGGGTANKFLTMTAQERAKWVAKKVTTDVMKRIDDKIKEGVDWTRDSLLNYIDKNYGTNYKELYEELMFKKGQVDAVVGAAGQFKPKG